jgi:HK97 family phage major capsid protein
MTSILVKLNEELEQVRAQREALRAKHSGETMPEDARATDETLTTKALKIQKGIEIERQRERDAAFAETAKYMDEPQYQIQRAVNSDDDGRQAMLRAGWEIRNGMVSRHTSLGEVDFCPEEVMFGPIPTDDEMTAKYFRQTREIFQPQYRNAYVKWLRNTSRQDSLAFNQLSPQEQNALSEGSGPDGGFLVPPDVQAEILQRLPQRSVMRRLARVVPTSRDKVIYPAVAPNATSGSIYSSGFVGGWVGETPAFSETDPQFQQFEISVKKARTATKLSNDWLADAAANMLAFLAQNGAENLALVEDNGFIAGLGSSNQPLGILNSGIATTTVEGSTTDTVSNTISNAGSAPLIDALPYLVPSQYAERGQWLMCRAIEGKIRGLVDANGRPWWMPQQVAGGSGATPRELGGYPVNNSEFVPTEGTNANKVLIFGDFSAYIIAQRAQMSTVVLRERFADNDQTGIIIFERVGGGLWNTDALRIGIV